MKSLIWQRVVVFVPTLLLTTIIVFALRLLIPGGPAHAIAGDNATPEVLAEINARFGLDKPIILQYFDWVGGVVRGDFGISYSTRLPVTEVIGPRFASSIEVVVIGLIISLLVGGAVGMISAIGRNARVGKVLFAASAIGVSVPVFWISTIFAGVLGATLGVLPANGFVPLSEGLVPHLRSILMPVFLIAVPTTALIARQLRSGMVAALESPYVRTARAVGLGSKRIYFDLALRNALGPVISFLPVAIAGLVGELVIIDNVFVLPGLGSAITSAVVVRDFPTLQAIVLLLAVTVILATLLADLALTATDPRRRKGLR